MEDIIDILKSQVHENDLTIEEQIDEFVTIDNSELILSNLINKVKINNIDLNASFFLDLEVFEDHLNNNKNSIFNIINKSITLFGNNWLKYKLSNPINDIGVLNKQKEDILFISDNSSKYKEYLNNIKGCEKELIWFWKDIDENTESLYSMMFFKFKILKLLNYNESVMLIYNIYNMFITPVMTALSPLSTIILLFVLKLYYKINIPFNKILKLLKNLFCNKTNIFHKKLNIISRFLKNTKLLYNLNNNIYLEKLNFDKLLNTFNNKIFNKEPSLFTNKGKIISTYYTFLEIKELLLPFIYYVGHIDSLYSISELYNTNEYCLPTYITNKKPIININNSWHPYLKNSVKNSINVNKNVIITGPNAAGKSTFIKTIMLNILLSQTLSISSSSNFEITPFNHLNTYLHIPDTKGKESLFEAELNRCLKYLHVIKNNKDKKYFIIMDELFSSTNPVEGCEAAKKICESLSKYNNNLTILTTHYSDLNKLEKTKKFINYKFLIKRNKKNKIIFTYKILKGISNDYIALELLRNKMNNL